MKHLDANGKNCPIPVIMAKKEIDGGEQNFTMLVDNAVAVENLKRLADSQNYQWSVTQADGGFAVQFAQGDAPIEAVPAAPAQPRGAGWTLFVGKDTIGSGAQELGQSLMKMFFYTLAQSDDLPASILFINSGVMLPAADEQVAEHLRALSEKGVEILVCGTCLNFYGVAEQLKIGTVSNMYDILQRMQRADKVITL